MRQSEPRLAYARSMPPQPARRLPVQLRADAELGFLSVLTHTAQFSQDGTEIDYVDEGGQDVLFAFTRLSVNLTLGSRHRVSLLYQPLQLDGLELIRRDLRIDDELFEAGTPMRFSYGFPFWRAGYEYAFVDSRRWWLSAGGALQIRNATITFESLDGRQLRTNRDIGPVPLLSASLRRNWDDSGFVELEVDGVYAPVKYLNGGDSDVEGALLDASIRAGLILKMDTEAFINLRYLAGGAEGTGDADGFGDGYTSNWLQFMTLSLGARANLL